MAKAQNAPVKYVIGVVRFPSVPNLNEFAGHLKTGLNRDYPISKSKMLTEFSIQINESNIEVQPQEVPVWQFMNVEKTFGVIVNQGLVGLHTAAYETHEEFIGRLMKVISAARDVVGDHLRYIEAVALRYIDLVVPGEGEALSDYLSQKLPMQVDGVDGLKVRDGVNILGMTTDVGHLRLQVFLNPRTVIPTDLMSPLFEDSGWSWELPERDFVTIDVDHSTLFSPPEELKLDDLEARLFSLRKPMSDIFKGIATPHAKEVWGLK